VYRNAVGTMTGPDCGGNGAETQVQRMLNESGTGTRSAIGKSNWQKVKAKGANMVRYIKRGRHLRPEL
jgi:hypothetical protein